MFPITKVDYCPTLRGKPGEFEGLLRLWSPIKPRIAPTIVLPSLPSFDLLKKRALDKKEAPRIHAKRIASCWHGLPFFLEARFLRFDLDPNEDATHLKRLLYYLEKMECKGIPTIDLRTAPHRLKTFTDYISNTGSGVALRCSLGDIDRPSVEDDVLKTLRLLNVDFAEVALVIDLSDAAIIGVPEFATLIVHAFSRLADIGPWAKIVVTASNYPEKNPADVNKHAIVPRREWAAWKAAARRDDRIEKRLTFGDFGADHGKLFFANSGGSPITHWRYATPESRLITRGGPSSEKIDGSIRFAAARIVNTNYFAGERFSWGDEFIVDCASGAGGRGYSTVWRAVNINHHMTQALVDIGAFHGRVVEQPAERQTPLQEVLRF